MHLRMEEATGGFEPPIAVLQTAALPLGYVAIGFLACANAELYLSRMGWRGAGKYVIVRQRV